MWKVVAGFLAFAALTMWLLSKAGNDIDISGEKHGIDVHPTASAPVAPAASAASNP